MQEEFKKNWAQRTFTKSGTARYFVNFNGHYTVRYYDFAHNFERSVTVTPSSLNAELTRAQTTGYKVVVDQGQLLDLLNAGLDPMTAGIASFARSITKGEQEQLFDVAERAREKVPTSIDWKQQLVKIAVIIAAETGIALAAALYHASKVVSKK